WIRPEETRTYEHVFGKSSEGGSAVGGRRSHRCGGFRPDRGSPDHGWPMEAYEQSASTSPRPPTAAASSARARLAGVLLLVDRFPQQFVRGLIHSDGCRTLNRFKTRLPSGRVAEYEYTRYFFSNLSADIRALFCEYCDRLGIRWTQSNARNISVSHRTSVAR